MAAPPLLIVYRFYLIVKLSDRLFLQVRGSFDENVFQILTVRLVLPLSEAIAHDGVANALCA